MVAIPSVRKKHDLALLWMADIDLHVQTYSPNHIDALIKKDNLFGGLLVSTGGLRSSEMTSRRCSYLVQESLDRTYANNEWRAIFPRAKLSHLQVSYSNHVPLLISTTEPINPKRRKRLPRRFEEKWVTHSDCEKVIREAWEGQFRNGSPMFVLFEKIKQCRHALVDWSRNNFGIFKTKLQEKQTTLEELSRENEAEHFQRIRTLKAKINTILHQDELFWRQRSHSIWLPAGDKNTKFFHQRANQRRRKNNISSIQDVDGSWKTSEDQISQVAENYFHDLFTSENPTDLDNVLDVVEKWFTTKMNNSLLQPYTIEEVR
ncbi:hypothetical protein SO802_006197 [Lithocarpus litseifolius]|uniref:Uncharacterized protein n=1 Tax=Lithocarpus litseifolius TaxID=425828 RepID=A0AAW2DLT4_9ROSI